MPEVAESEIESLDLPDHLSSSSTTPTPDEDISASPKIRSLSMSQSLALSVIDEVSHMIHPSTSSPRRSSFQDLTSGVKRSSSVSSLTRLKANISPPYTFPGPSHSSAPPGLLLPSEFRENLTDQNVPGTSFQNTTAGVSVEASPAGVVSLVGKSSIGSSAISRNEVLIGIVVSRWDNIVGPQCIYLWTEKTTSSFYPGRLSDPLWRHVKYVTDHTVDHHDVDGTLVSPCTIRSALCLVHDLDLAYLSVSIRVPSADAINCGEGNTVHNYPRGDIDNCLSGDRPAVSVPHAIAVLARLKFLHHFLLMRPLVAMWLAEFSPKIGVLLCKNKLQSSMINSWCAELCKTMTTIWNCWWQQQRFTLNSTSSNENSSASPTPSTPTPPAESEGKTSRPAVKLFIRMVSRDTQKASKLENYWDYLPPVFFGKSSLETMLTSHLSTGGTSIVVGSDVTSVNQIIRFLLCFSKIEEGYCSRYVLPTLPDTFMKGIFVQGLILGEIGEKSISVNQVNSNLHPSTYIEVSGKNLKVRQNSVVQHRQRRETTLIHELTSYWNSTAYSSPATELFPQQVKEIAGFVAKLFHELALLKPEKRFARLLLFRRSLHAKAISLITYLHSIRLKPERDVTRLLKELKDTLRMDDAEYLIVQVTAEKIRPGVLAMIRSY